MLSAVCCQQPLGSWGEWHVTEGGFFLLFPGKTELMFSLLPKGLVISVLSEMHYTLLFVGLQLHVVPVFSTCMIQFEYAQ